jgi:hypothetical protein
MHPRATRQNIPPLLGTPRHASGLSAPAPASAADERRTARLCSALMHTRAVADVATADLRALLERLRVSVPRAFAACDFGGCRGQMALSDAVKRELIARGALSPGGAMLRGPLEAFDQETARRLEALQCRHRALQRDFAEKWQADMQAHYFAPTVRLQALREQAIALARDGRRAAAAAAAAAAADLEAQEARAAQGQFQKDYDALCARMQRKRDREADAFAADRAQRRAALARAAARRASASSAASPRAARPL